MFDAATGSIIKRYEKTAGTMELVLDRDMIFAVTGDQWNVNPNINHPEWSKFGQSAFPSEAYGPKIIRPESPKNELMAVDANSGQER